MKEGKCNRRGIGTSLVITVCLLCLMIPAMTQPTLSFSGNASDTIDEEIPVPLLTPVPVPISTPTPSPNPTPAPAAANINKIRYLRLLNRTHILLGHDELRKETRMNYPDLVVAKFVSPSREDKNASVNIENRGIGNATNVTVRFEVREYREIEVKGSGTGWQPIKKEGAENIRIHLLNASECVSVHIPPQWGDEKNYTQPRELMVTVDPDNNITELNEGNNTKTGVMYTDLSFVKYKKKVGNKEKEGKIHFVQPIEEMLCMLAEDFVISATIKNINETEGIVFPASDFNVSLLVQDLDNNDEVVFRKSKHYQDFLPTNKTLYAGEEEEIVFKEKSIFPQFSGDYKYYTVRTVTLTILRNRF